MMNLTTVARQLREQCPTLNVSGSLEELTVRRGRKTVRLRHGDEISRFDARERSRRRSEGLSYLDLDSGALYIDQPELFVYVKLALSTKARLSPYQCALLSAILERGGREWFESGVTGPQVDLIRRIKLELGVEVSPMAMSRFLEALRTKGIVLEDGPASLVAREALTALREDFRLSAVGRADAYAGDYRSVEESLGDQLEQRFARGVADVLSKRTGAWIEPRDYLVDRSALPSVQNSLGGPVPRGYEEATVVIRPAMRVPLGLLTLGQPSIQPLLGLAEAAQSESSVARQAALEAWKELSDRKWK
jgi:hypothetical protein